MESSLAAKIVAPSRDVGRLNWLIVLVDRGAIRARQDDDAEFQGGKFSAALRCSESRSQQRGVCLA